jgi:hypothetical protein
MLLEDLLVNVRFSGLLHILSSVVLAVCMLVFRVDMHLGKAWTLENDFCRPGNLQK